MFEKIKKAFNHQEEQVSVNGLLSGSHVAILATDGFEQSELFEPLEALQEAGAKVSIVSIKSGKIKGWNHTHWGKTIPVDLTVNQANREKFDFLMLPGGVMNPDQLRNNYNAVAFVKNFVNEYRPIAAICHGAQTLIETGLLKGKRMTSWPSLKTDFINAGARWVDEEVVKDTLLVTSRMPKDIPAFNREMIQLFSEYKNQHPISDSESYVVTL
ncbi:MAG: type 1 glutamine amidotransferase domain-containing protein [Bacteriovoracaceae bacterium]